MTLEEYARKQDFERRSEALKKAMNRYKKATGDDGKNFQSVVVFLQDEIDRYRYKIKCMEARISELSERAKSTIEDTEDFYSRIKISFINAGSITVEPDDWDDYEVYNGFLVIKKGETWVAMYNMKEIFSIVLEK